MIGGTRYRVSPSKYVARVNCQSLRSRGSNFAADTSEIWKSEEESSEDFEDQEPIKEFHEVAGQEVNIERMYEKYEIADDSGPESAPVQERLCTFRVMR